MKSYYRPVHEVSPFRSNQDYRKQTNERSDSGLPIVTVSMLIIIILVFIAMVVVGHGDVGNVAHLFGAKEPELIRAGQWWRLITPIFLHGSWMHLIVNGLSLVWFGGQIERIYGPRKYLLIYMVAGVVGNLLSYLMLPTPSLGASGALFGLIGAGIVFPLRFRNLLPAPVRESILRQLATVALINLGLSFMSGIDRYAHFGGFFGGAFMALFLLPEVLDDRPRRTAREAVLNVGVLLTIVIVMVAAGMQWKVARNEIHPSVISYTPDGSNSWWRFQLSDRWQRGAKTDKAGSSWIGPQGATIYVVDSLSDAELFEHTEQWRAAQGVKSIPIMINGQAGTLSTTITGGQVTQLCQILVGGRAVDIELACSSSAYAAVNRDYAALLGSIRFLQLHGRR